VIPYDRGDLVAAIHETGMLLSVEHQEAGTAVHAHVSERLAADLAPYVVSD
jgi:GTP-binding protein HflX